jgi:hypothetical protein
MVIARTARGRHRLGPAVLAVLIVVSVQQVPPVDVTGARSKPRDKLSSTVSDAAARAANAPATAAATPMW